MEGKMQIDLYLEQGDDLEPIAVNVPLAECYPDDPEGLALAEIGLTLNGIHFDGGGAAPVHVMRPAGA